MLTKDITRRYHWMRQHGAAMVVGQDARVCLIYARAEAQLAEDINEGRVEVVIEPEQEEWDGDCPAPDYLVSVALVRPCPDHGIHCRHAEYLASLGMVGINDMRDPRLRIVQAELATELYA